MSIAELTSIVSPPISPVDAGPDELRQTVERSLGLQLPSDFIDISTAYGSGMFADGQFWCLNPFASWYRSNVEQICEIFSKIKAMEGDGLIPYDIFPAQDSLFPWGCESNGHGMFWLTRGKSDEWPIILFNRDTSEFEELKMPVSTFLSKVFSCELRCILWSDETQQCFSHQFESS